MSRLALPTLLACAALTLACFGGKAKPTQVWTLRAPPPAAPGVDADGPALGIGRVGSIPELRTTRLTYRVDDGHELKHYPNDVWSDYPDRMLRERLLSSFLASRSYRSVTAAPPRRGLDLVLSTKLIEYDEWDASSGVSVKVAVRWTLESAEGELLGSGIARSEQAAAKNVAAVVGAFDLAVTEVLADITAAVTSLATSR